MPLETAKNHLGTVIAAIGGMVTSAWVFIGMVFRANREVDRASVRIKKLEVRVDHVQELLVKEIRRYEEKAEARDLRIENKLDRLIEKQLGIR